MVFAAVDYKYSLFFVILDARARALPSLNLKKRRGCSQSSAAVKGMVFKQFTLGQGI